MGTCCRLRQHSQSYEYAEIACADSSTLTKSPGSLPILFDDGVATATGFEDIIAYLRNHPEVAEDLDANLTSQQLTDKTACVNLHPK
jgi:hypothetical protein